MPLSCVTERQAIDHIVRRAVAGHGGWVITPNLDQLRQFRKYPQLRPMYAKADLVLADGMPLIWASRIQRTPLPQRVAGSALIFTLSETAAGAGLPVFLLGGNPGAAAHAADELRKRYPSIKIAGTHCPPIGFDKDQTQIQAIIELLRHAKPRIVFVGLGFPKQERLIERIRNAVPNAWFLGIGVSLSFVSGEIRRAPRWIQAVGLEWIHRMCQEPGRLAGRYLVHGIPFAICMLAQALAARWRSKP